MSPYVFGGLLLSFVAWSGFMYYEGHSNEATLCKANDEQAAVAAYQHKDEVTGKQTAVTQAEVTTYEKDVNAIYALYPDRVPTSTNANMPKLPASASRTCPFSSEKYKLTFKQCDIDEAKLKRLFDRDTRLSEIK